MNQERERERGGGGGGDKNPIQRLRIMRRREDTRVLHVPLQVPELLEPDAADVDDVGRGDDGRLRVRPRQGRAERHDEAQQVLVQREEAEQARGHLARLVRLGRRGRGHLGAVGGHVLAVQVLDDVDVDGDAAAVAAAGPLGVLCGHPVSEDIL